MEKNILQAVFLGLVFVHQDAMLGDQKKATQRKDIYTVQCLDGSKLAILGRAYFPNRHHSSGAMITLCDSNGTVIWRNSFTDFDFTPGRTCYFALVKTAEDHVVLFSTWNGRHVTIAADSGKVLRRGNGDALLTQFDDWIPLKLTLVYGTSKGYADIRKEDE